MYGQTVMGCLKNTICVKITCVFEEFIHCLHIPPLRIPQLLWGAEVVYCEAENVARGVCQ